VTRLWLRAALRRPLRALVLVLALTAISATTVAALVAADGLSSRFDRDARAEWGSVDVEGRAATTSVFDDSLGRYLLDKAGVPGAPRLVLPAAFSRGGHEEQGLALGLGAEESTLPPLQGTGVVDPAALGADQVTLNARLANRLHARLGDRVSIVVAVPEWDETRSTVAEPLVHRAKAVTMAAEVAGIATDAGVADLHRTPNVLVNRSVLQRATGLEPGKSTVLDLQTSQAKALIDDLDPVARRAGVALSPVKKDALKTASGEGGLFRSILLTMAVLVVAAAFGGTVDLVLALLRERSGELALLRAWGASRRALTRAVVLETTAYGAVGALLGALLGVPLASLVGGALADHLVALDAGRGRDAVRLTTEVRPTTLLTGALLVLVVAAVVGRVAARRALAVPPDVLLRDPALDLDAGSAPLSSRRPVVLLALGCLCVGAGTSAAALLYLGLTLLLAATWTWRRRLTNDRPRLDRTAAALGLVWSVAGAAALGNFSQGVQAGFGVITVAGETAVACGCVLLVPVLRSAMRLVRTYAAVGPAQLALVVAGARAQQQRARSGVLMGVVGGAFFGVAALLVLGNAAALPAAEQGGGFTVLGTAVADVDPAQLASRSPSATGVLAVPEAMLPETGYRTEDADGKRATVPYPVRLVAAEPDLVSEQHWGLAASLPAYRTAQAALTAVETDGDKAVVDRYTRPEGAQPGDDVVLDLGSGPRRFTLVAVLDTFVLKGVLVSDSAFRDTGLAHGNTLVLARGGPAAAAQLAAAGRASGLELRTVQSAADQVVDANRAFTDVFAVVVALALVIAVVATSAAVVRSGRERRAELGVLRALGLRRRSVVLLLAAEPVLVATLGTLLGSLVGVGVLRALFATGYSDLPFRLPAARLAVLAVGSLVLLGAACAAAAVPAARRPVDGALADLG